MYMERFQPGNIKYYENENIMFTFKKKVTLPHLLIRDLFLLHILTERLKKLKIFASNQGN